MEEGKRVKVARLVARPLQHPLASASFMSLHDNYGLIPLIIWPTVYQESKHQLRSRLDERLLDPSKVTNAFRRIANKAGLDKVRLHDLRHTLASLMLQAGVHPKIVGERLGHASVNIILDTYATSSRVFRRRLPPGSQSYSRELSSNVVKMLPIERVVGGSETGSHT